MSFNPPARDSVMPLRTQLFINNEWVDAKSGKTFETIDPRTEEVIAKVQEAGEQDIDAAVEAATAAFKTWKKSDGSTRRNLLLKLADLVEKNRDRLAEVESLDNGKPLHVADGVDLGFAIETYRYYAGFADKVGGKVIKPTQSSSSMFCFTWHEPIGVCGAIIPWNFPLVMQAWKLAPALAMGCTIVMKLSEKTPLSGLMMCDLIKEAGFPAGVVNVVNGFGATTGTAIARHPGIAKVAFTGSSATGPKIVRAAAESNMKKVSLELGEKSPMVICKDADLAQVAAECNIGLWIQIGQCCYASSRIFVHADIQDAFIKKVTDMAKRLRTKGKTKAEPVCGLGPQVDKTQFEQILRYIEVGKKEGAKCVLGGGRDGEKGYFVQPTIFTGVRDEMKIATKEICGPVIQLIQFQTLEEAIERANKTHFGLATGLCARDNGTALKSAAEMDPEAKCALENWTEVKCVMMP